MSVEFRARRAWLVHCVFIPLLLPISSFAIGPTSATAVVVSSFSPSVAAQGETVTISGSGFLPANCSTPQVFINGVPMTGVQAVSSSRLSAHVPAGAVSRQISVKNCPGSVYARQGYSATALQIIPVINSFDPVRASPGKTVMLVGDGFTAVSQVRFGGIPAQFTVQAPNVLSAIVPASATVGSALKIQVTTFNAKIAEAPTPLTVASPTEVPVISSMSPSSGPSGSAATLIGNGFSRDQQLFVGSLRASLQYIDSRQIRVVIPAGLPNGSSYRISIKSPDGSRALASSSTSFVINNLPSIIRISPDSGPVGSAVEIQGSYFTGRAGSPAAEFCTVAPVSACVLSSPGMVIAGTSGKPDKVSVRVPAGISTGASSSIVKLRWGTLPTANYAQFFGTLSSTPSVSAISPDSAVAGGAITVTGRNFVPQKQANGSIQAQVLVGSGIAPSYVFVSSTRIAVPIGSTATSGRIVFKNLVTGASATSSGSFTLMPPARLTSVAPSSGGAGAAVTLAGVSLSRVTQLLWRTGASAWTSIPFQKTSETSISAKVPAGAVTGPIRIATASGHLDSTFQFTVATVAPQPSPSPAFQIVPSTIALGSDVSWASFGIASPAPAPPYQITVADGACARYIDGGSKGRFVIPLRRPCSTALAVRDALGRLSSVPIHIAAAPPALIWPDQAPAGRKANSDTWIRDHHRQITEMRPRVVVFNFANGKADCGSDRVIPGSQNPTQARAHAEQFLDSWRRATIYQPWLHPGARPFINPVLEKFLDLRDAPDSPHAIYANSALMPLGIPDADGIKGVAYEKLFSSQYAPHLGYLENGRYLNLRELIAGGRVHAVILMSNAVDRKPCFSQTPNNPAEVTGRGLEVATLQQVYDGSTQPIPNRFIRYWGPGDVLEPAPDATSLNLMPWFGRSIRVIGLHASRGPNIHGLGHDLEYVFGLSVWSPPVVPGLSPYVRRFMDLDLNERIGVPFASLGDSPQRPGGGDRLDYADCSSGACRTLLYQPDASGAYARRVENYVVGCGNVHFPPGARNDYDYYPPKPVFGLCETFMKPWESPKAVSKDAWRAYTDDPAIDKDSGNDFLIYWGQNMPGYQNESVMPGTTVPMPNWWPYMFY